jgi:hypothetical protein
VRGIICSIAPFPEVRHMLRSTRSFSRRDVIVALAVLTLSACKSGDAPAPAPTPAPTPVISSFTGSPGTIARGGSATLSWSVTGASTLVIQPDPAPSPARR